MPLTNKKKIIAYSIACILIVAAIADAIRYLQPTNKNKPQLETDRPANSNQLIMVYNANGGVYPGIADVLRKEFFAKSYPCNLCYLAFGTFGMRPQWKQFIDSLPYAVTGIHKDSYKRNYVPANLPLPAILISDGNNSSLLVTAAEINAQANLAGLMKVVRSKLK